MSAFNAGANCFLNSEFKVRTIGPNPTTERGASTVINIHPREPRVIYPSGKYIIVRNLEDPNDCFIYRGHSFPTTVAKFSPNGYWVCSADSSGKVKVWSWDNPEHLIKLDTPVFAGAILDVDWDSESKKIVAVGNGSGILAKVFTWDTGNSVGEMVGHNKKILSVAYKPTRPYRIMTSGEDFRSCFYAGPPFKFGHSNSSHSNFANCIRYSSDGSKAVSVGSDKKIQLYEGATGQPTTEIENAHAGGIYSVAFSPDASRFVTASADKTLKIWDASSLTSEITLNPSPEPQVGDMQVSVLWVGTRIISLSLNGTLNVFDLASPLEGGLPNQTLEGHQVSITAMHLDRPTATLLTGSFDGVIVARNLATGETRKLVGSDRRNVAGAAHGGKVSGLSLSPEGEIASIGWDDSLRFGNLGSGAYHSDLGLSGQPQALASNPSSGLLVVATTSEIALFRGGSQVGSQPISFMPTSVDLWGDSELAVGGNDNKTHVFSISEDASTLTEVASIETRSPVSSVSYSPTGEHLAIGDNGRQVEVYARGSWEPVVQHKWCYHTSRVSCLSWSPSGARLASGGSDENIFIWVLATPTKKLQIPFAHMSGVVGVDWLDEERLVSAGADHVVTTWKVPAEI